MREAGEQAVHNWAVHGPRSGAVTLTLDISADASASQTIVFEIRIIDPSRTDPFANRLTIRVRPAAPSGGPSGSGTSRTSTGGQGGQGGGSSLTLPNIVEVAEADWHLHGFNESAALVLKHA